MSREACLPFHQKQKRQRTPSPHIFLSTGNLKKLPRERQKEHRTGSNRTGSKTSFAKQKTGMKNKTIRNKIVALITRIKHKYLKVASWQQGRVVWKPNSANGRQVKMSTTHKRKSIEKKTNQIPQATLIGLGSAPLK
jgi:hypothetical protein